MKIFDYILLLIYIIVVYLLWAGSLSIILKIVAGIYCLLVFGRVLYIIFGNNGPLNNDKGF